MATGADLEQQVRAYLARTDPAAGQVQDVTERVLADSSGGPGERSRLVATARATAPGPLPPTLLAVLQRVQRMPDLTMGRISKPLAYAQMFRFMGKRDHANVIRLIRGGHLRVYEVSGGAPIGSLAAKDDVWGSQRSYYVLTPIAVWST